MGSMYMGVPADTLRAAEDGIRKMLNQAFEGRVVFGPVKVESTADHYGEDNLNIVVVYDGDHDRLDPDKLNKVSTELASVLSVMGFRNMPTESYIHKNEYDEWLVLQAQSPWEPDTD